MKNRRRSSKRRSFVSRIYTIIGVLAIVFAITFTTSLMFSSFFDPIEASASNYVKVSVAPGDTLWEIAEQYHTQGDIRNYIIEIKKVNDLKDGNLLIDQTLYIPIKEA